VDEIMRITDGRGVDVVIEAQGKWKTFEDGLRVLKPGGILSSLGLSSKGLIAPLNAFDTGSQDKGWTSTELANGGKRMRSLMSVTVPYRLGLGSMITHRFDLSQIVQAYDLSANQKDGVLKVAITSGAQTAEY